MYIFEKLHKSASFQSVVIIINNIHEKDQDKNQNYLFE